MSIDSSQVSAAHDAMAEEYDQCDDLWYPWLFTQIHEFIAKNIPFPAEGKPKALDVGCGTGFQSFLLAQAGFDVDAFDLSTELVRVARSKITAYARPPLEAPPLFSSVCCPEIVVYHAKLAKHLDVLRSGRPVVPPTFHVDDATTFDYGRDQYDVITCCGSVLSFIDTYSNLVEKLAHGLRPGGVLLLEVEQKANLDLVWPILDKLLMGSLGYEQEWKDIFHNLLFSPGQSVRVDYPFALHDGRTVTLPIWLFSIKDLQRTFCNAYLQIVDRLGVHWATNFIPSTVLHKSTPSRFLISLAEILTHVDGSLGRMWPTWRLGCSAVFALRRNDT